MLKVCQRVPESSKETGNTNQSPPKINPAKSWVFTLNNYTQEQINKLKQLECSKVPLIVFQSEVGESGTPHLQGVIKFDTKRRPIGFVGIKEIHFEKMRGTINEACAYASKDDTHDNKVRYIRGWIKPEKIMTYEPRNWQKQVIKHLEEPKDRRKILWFWDNDGNIGKTEICRYVLVNYQNSQYIGGRGTDMKYSIATYFEENKTYPDNILINIPKNGRMDYEALEEVKDALFFSSKYKSSSVIGNPPRVVVFANYPPEDNLNGRIEEVDLNVRCTLPPRGGEGGNVLEQVNVMNSCFADWATPKPVAPVALLSTNTTV